MNPIYGSIISIKCNDSNFPTIQTEIKIKERTILHITSGVSTKLPQGHKNKI